MKKTISILLILALLLPVFAGCSEGTVTDETEGTAQNSQTPSAIEETDAPVEEADAKYAADIPDGTDYGGMTFTVLTYPNSDSIWSDVDWTADEITGEVLNDAVYTRKQQVDDLLNIRIVPAYMTGSGDTSTLENSVLSGDGAYQLATLAIQSSFNVAQNGRIHELNSFAEKGTLDLTAPWWDPNILKEISVGGKNFCLTGDIGTMYKKSIGVVMFNKVIYERYQLGSDAGWLINQQSPDRNTTPYDLMNAGKWTIDAMVALGSKVSTDLDGDGVMTSEDQYGLITFCNMLSIAMIGGEVSFFSKDQDDQPYDTFMSERTLTVVDKLATLMYNPDITYSWSRAGDGEDPAFVMYQSDKALFYYGELHAVATMREMESDFGILPMPKYDEVQTGYHHCVNPDVAATIVVPRDNIEYEKTGYIMDALGAASKNELTPAYYDVSLRGKISRDEESQQSLDIIIASVRYDLGYLGGFGITSMLNSMADSYNTDLASQYARVTKIVNKTLERMLNKFAELGDD